MWRVATRERPASARSCGYRDGAAEVAMWRVATVLADVPVIPWGPGRGGPRGRMGRGGLARGWLTFRVMSWVPGRGLPRVRVTRVRPARSWWWLLLPRGSRQVGSASRRLVALRSASPSRRMPLRRLVLCRPASCLGLFLVLYLAPWRVLRLAHIRALCLAVAGPPGWLPPAPQRTG
jgi:hypothetical protein